MTTMRSKAPGRPGRPWSIGCVDATLTRRGPNARRFVVAGRLRTYAWSGASGLGSWRHKALVLLSVGALSLLPLFAGPGSGALPAAAAGDPVIAVAGDIACTPGQGPTATSCQQAATGNVLASINPVVVLPQGDTQYTYGTSTEYAGSYDKVAWGADKGISRPAPGNHEYNTTGATGYYGYFGANAGDPTKGYYSYSVSGPGGAFHWHMIVLNSECAQVGGCGVGSPQEIWLKNDLAANPGTCTMAYWHRPRFSSSSTAPSSTTYVPFWNDLYAAGSDVVLNGHAHDYERFSPQTSSGASDPTKGLTEFVVGTGGDDFHQMGTAIANSVVRNNNSFGVMKMTLHSGSYDWQFIPASGYSFTDSGTASCHSAGTADTTAPSQPTGLTATATTPTQANLSWTASTDNVGVTGYNIYRGMNGSTPTLLTTTTTSATTYADSSVVANTPYTYQVQALDAAGNKSLLSAAASVTVPASTDTTAPTAPTSLTADVVNSGEVDMSWVASSDTGTGVSGYRVYRRLYGTTSWTLLATTTGTAVSYQDLTTVQNTRYDYQVTAFDGAGNVSGPSNILTVATPPGPSTTTYTFNSAGDATIDLTNSGTNYGSDTKLVVDNSPVDDFLLKFNVNASSCQSITGATLRLTNNADGSVKGGDFYTTGSNWSESTVTWTTAPGRGTFLNSLGAVSSGATYTVDVTKGVTTSTGEVDFRVATTSSDGAHYYSKEGAGTNTVIAPQLTLTCANSTTDTLAPTASSSLKATAPNGGEVDLSWTASTDNVGVVGYNIYKGGVKVASVAGTALSYADLTVSPSTTYSYQVSGVDAAGNVSPMSNTTAATTPASSGPAAPGNLSATAANSSEIDLTWTPSTTTGIAGYNIYRGPRGGTLVKVNSSGPTAGPSSYQDATVAAGTAYDYQVTAVDATGLESTRSSPATATTPAAADTSPPTAPSSLSAKPTSSSEVDLSWIASTDNVGVTGYTIYRAPAGTTSFVSVATTATATTSYQNKSVSPSTGYDYQVTASDGAGNKSLPSNTATATTPATSTSQTYTFPSVADATIDFTNSTINYGGDTKLMVDNSPVDDSLVRFNVATTGCTSVTSASLRLVDNADGSVKGGDFYSTGSSWTESTVTWGTAPQRGIKLATLGAVTSGATYTVPLPATGITSLNGPVSYRIGTDNSDGAHYYSKEGAGTTSSLIPQLTVTCT